MSDDQQFCLRWNDFQTNMVASFKHLRDEKSFCDVTIATEGQHTKAHKMILCACSPYFKNLLEQNPAKHPIIILKDVPFQHLTGDNWPYLRFPMVFTLNDFSYFGVYVCWRSQCCPGKSCCHVLNNSTLMLVFDRISCPLSWRLQRSWKSKVWLKGNKGRMMPCHKSVFVCHISFVNYF